jgi:2-oxoglutarate dehydrogenase E2 component (dihydrolipoamide succinyltransferase)
MSVEFTVPQMGESITEAIVSRWNKKVGDSVRMDEPLVVLETDKVTVDVPAPAGGSLTQISAKEGDKVRVGEVLGSISPGTGATATAPEAPAAAPQRASAAQEEAGRTAMTPVARRVAEDKQLDPSKIRGSGTGGRILKDDVLGHVQGGGNGAPAPSVARPATPQPPAAPRVTSEREERVKMTPLRRKVAERLLAAQSNAAILTTFNEIDMGAVMELRKTYGEKFQKKHGTRLGFMGFFVKATLEALKGFPQLNAQIDGEDVIFKHYYDIGVAVSGSRGLVVPVVRDADTLSLADLEKQIAELGDKARNDKLTMNDLQGGTFTISNGGVFGSLMSTPILNPPQIGILGMHKIEERPVVRDGQIVIRPMMYVALSYDHRLIDGRESVQFLVKIKEAVEDPQRLLLEI